MTNNEKALELVQKCLDDWPYAATRVFDIMKRLEQVKALLKEQEPVEPIKAQINQNRPLYFRCYCRRCGNPVGNMIGHSVTRIHSNFCDRCGQAVKWE